MARYVFYLPLSADSKPVALAKRTAIACGVTVIRTAAGSMLVEAQALQVAAMAKALPGWQYTLETTHSIPERPPLRRLRENARKRSALAMPRAADPSEPLTAAELGRALGVSGETVRQRELAGELFSIVRPARKRGREYPAFQAWPAICGEPLARILTALAPFHGGAAAYGFFTSPTDLLGGLTPIEAMLGELTQERPLAPETERLLSATVGHRLKAVERAAQACAAQLIA